MREEEEEGGRGGNEMVKQTRLIPPVGLLDDDILNFA